MYPQGHFGCYLGDRFGGGAATRQFSETTAAPLLDAWYHTDRHWASSAASTTRGWAEEGGDVSSSQSGRRAQRIHRFGDDLADRQVWLHDDPAVARINAANATAARGCRGQAAGNRGGGGPGQGGFDAERAQALDAEAHALAADRRRREAWRQEAAKAAATEQARRGYASSVAEAAAAEDEDRRRQKQQSDFALAVTKQEWEREVRRQRQPPPSLASPPAPATQFSPGDLFLWGEVFERFARGRGAGGRALDWDGWVKASLFVHPSASSRATEDAFAAHACGAIRGGGGLPGLLPPAAFLAACADLRALP